MRKVHPDLMGPPREGPGLHQGRPSFRDKNPEFRSRLLPGGRHAIPGDPDLCNGSIDEPLPFPHLTRHQSQIALLHVPVLQERRQARRGPPVFRKEHHSGGSPIEAVDNAYRFFTPVLSQIGSDRILDRAFQLVRSPLGIESGRLAHRHYIRVFMEDVFPAIGKILKAPRFHDAQDYPVPLAERSRRHPHHGFIHGASPKVDDAAYSALRQGREEQGGCVIQPFPRLRGGDGSFHDHGGPFTGNST